MKQPLFVPQLEFSVVAYITKTRRLMVFERATRNRMHTLWVPSSSPIPRMSCNIRAKRGDSKVNI